MAKIGDIVAADGRVGQVVDLDSVTNRAVIRPFPLPGQEGLKVGESYVAQGEVRVLRRGYEREIK